MAFGIKIANEVMGDTKGLAYTTENIHAQIELGRTPPHLDRLTISSLTSFPANTTNSETIFTMQHGLGYVPKVFSYYYMYDAPSSDATRLGSYFEGSILINDSAGMTNVLYTYVDDKTLSIIHYFSDPNNFGHGNESQTYKFRVKYMITSLEDTLPVNNPINTRKIFT